MAASYKVPGVYVEEISKFPPSIAEVETAIPAFIGYTQKAEKDGEDLKNKPTKIKSMLEYELYFGENSPFTITGVTETSDKDGAVGVEIKPTFYLFDSLQLYYANGGGDCYIVSVGTHEETINADTLVEGIKDLEIFDEPTILLFPDAVKFTSQADLSKVQQAAIKQCAYLGDRVAILDLLKDDADKKHGQGFRDSIGMTDLKYAAAYTPWIKASLSRKIRLSHFTDPFDLTKHTLPTTKIGEKPNDIPINEYIVKYKALLSGVGENVRKNNDKLRVKGSFEADFLEEVTTAPAGAIAWIYKIVDTLETYVKDALIITDANYRNFIQNFIVPIVDANIAKIIKQVDIKPTFIETLKTLQGAAKTNIDGNPAAKTLFDDAKNATDAANVNPLIDAYNKASTEVEKKTTKDLIDANVAAKTLFDDAKTATDAANANPLIDAFNKAKNSFDETSKRWSKINAENPAGPAPTAPICKNLLTDDGPLDAIFNALNLMEVGMESAIESYEQTLINNVPFYRNLLQALSTKMSEMPPSGAIAGLYCKTDNARGVWKAPANISISNVSGVTKQFTQSELGAWNIDVNAGKSINAIRSITGQGVMVMGARTLAGNDNEWRYVPVRRFFNFVEESTKKSTQWAVFEPNDANLWLKVRTMIESFLYNLWRRGALAGAKPEHAYYVRCGLNLTMTAQDILEGRLNVEIGMAAVRPAEFIILKFSHKLQES